VVPSTAMENAAPPLTRWSSGVLPTKQSASTRTPSTGP
jgi:hypothetical protein